MGRHGRRAMTMNSAIGLFDSGLGGLTVLHAIHQHLPNESVVYLGDTARVPYGIKSPETIIRYSLENARFLVARGVKALVVACNSSSAHALPVLQETFSIPVIGVIDPGAQAAAKATKNHHVGVIGTSATIASGAYPTALSTLNPAITCTGAACPLFVPLVEEGWIDDAITEAVISRYLMPMTHESIDTLILGCTHYPLLKTAIARVMGDQICLIDSGEACAQALRRLLEEKNMLASQRTHDDHVYVTDVPARFETIARRFLGERLPIVKRIELAP